MEGLRPYSEIQGLNFSALEMKTENPALIYNIDKEKVEFGGLGKVCKAVRKSDSKQFALK